jgi:hypothetical protein
MIDTMYILKWPVVHKICRQMAEMREYKVATAGVQKKKAIFRQKPNEADWQLLLCGKKIISTSNNVESSAAFQQPRAHSDSLFSSSGAILHCVRERVCLYRRSLFARDQKGPFLRVVVVKVVKSYPSNTREPTRAGGGERERAT